MLTKQIIYFGQKAIVGCDARCSKAWGTNSRPTIEENGETYFKSDKELKRAPANPGTYEGGCAKPKLKSERLNKWCVRECERCSINEAGTAPIEENLECDDFSQRVKI